MKYAILLGDGMADWPMAELDGKTPLEVAKIPNMNEIAKAGTVGIVKTIPRGMKAASDVANLAVMGYDPKIYYTGRGPLEAANIGVTLTEGDVAFRCNLITANNDTLADYSAGHIHDKEATTIINFLNEKLGSDRIRFCPGKSYRHLLIIKTRSHEEATDYVKTVCVPPHDITGKSISKNLPKGKQADSIIDIMQKARQLLEKHEINKVRLDLGENPANMIWLWGQGTDPNMPTFKGMFGLTGAVISAVDLLNGIGKLVGLDVVSVPGATGYYDTNYQGKGEYAVNALKDKDFVFVHVEAPDEAGHNGEVREKIRAIENFDKFVVGPVWQYLKNSKEYRIMVLPDHATPVEVRTHVADPVPFVMAGKGIGQNGFEAFTEKNGAASEVKFKSGAALTGHFLKNK
jgi:2,3-bisphosphoglycerate-independent phosphoglycerate mutase